VKREKMTDKAVYRDIVDRLSRAFGPRLKAVVLFGSHARRQAREDSDHDLFLVIEALPKPPMERVREIRTVIWDAPLRVNTIAKTPEEVEENLTPMLLEIGMDGVCLFGDAYFKNFRDKVTSAVRQAKLRRSRVGKEWYWQFEEIPAREWEISWEGFRELDR
jgi:predicted nucleotidyltransferase